MENEDRRGAAANRYLYLKVRPELRTRLDTCARLEGLAPPEFVRLSIMQSCERSEKLHGQRRRAQEAAARTAEDAAE